MHLRHADAEDLKGIITSVASQASATNTSTSRVKYMLEAINDLKNNRHKLVTDNSAAYAVLLKVIRQLCEKRSQMLSDALRIPWKDLIAAEEKGRRWLVGSAWAGASSLFNHLPSISL